MEMVAYQTLCNWATTCTMQYFEYVTVELRKWNMQAYEWLNKFHHNNNGLVTFDRA